MRGRLVIHGVTGAGLALLVACSTSPTGLAEAGKRYVLILAPSSTTIQGATTVRLTASVIDLDGKTIHPEALAWSSSNPAIASVAPGGMVSGIGEGTAQISATWREAQGTSLVSVVSTQPHPKCLKLAQADKSSSGGPSGGCLEP